MRGRVGTEVGTGVLGGGGTDGLRDRRSTNREGYHWRWMAKWGGALGEKG